MNIAIIEDLPADRQLAAEYLDTYFSSAFPGLMINIDSFSSGEEFLDSFTPRAYDLIFIDYYLNDLSGLETARVIRHTDRQAILIFTTASRDFAVDGYRVKASGYLIKPFTYEQFAETLSLIDISQLKERQFLEIANGMETIKIIVTDIICCDIAGHYTQIHTKSSGLKRIRMPFTEMVRLLKPFPEFLSCYRGCLINMNFILRMEDLTFIMEDGERIPFRKKAQAQIMEAYSNFLFCKVRDAK